MALFWSFALFLKLPPATNRVTESDVRSRAASVVGGSAPAATAVFQVLEGLRPGGGGGSVVANLRLVGTFFEYAEIGTNSLRQAILESRGPEGGQAILSIGDTFGGWRLNVIERESVTMQNLESGVARVLALEWSPGQYGLSNTGINNQTGSGTEPATGQAPYGTLIASNHWVLNRQSLMGYYQELRDNPDRLLKVFDTLYPLRDEKNRITGYTVNIVGEPDFFAAMGLRQGDVVRKVNKRPMTNRRLAERFIADFVKDRANAFVLEVERDGTPEQLVYQIR